MTPCCREAARVAALLVLELAAGCTGALRAARACLDDVSTLQSWRAHFDCTKFFAEEGQKALRFARDLELPMRQGQQPSAQQQRQREELKKAILLAARELILASVSCLSDLREDETRLRQNGLPELVRGVKEWQLELLGAWKSEGEGLLPLSGEGDELPALTLGAFQDELSSFLQAVEHGSIIRPDERVGILRAERKMVYDAMTQSERGLSENSGQAGMGHHWYQCPKGHVCESAMLMLFHMLMQGISPWGTWHVVCVIGSRCGNTCALRRCHWRLRRCHAGVQVPRVRRNDRR